MSNTEDIILAEYEKQLAAAAVPDYFLSSQFCNNGTQITDYVIPPATSADPAAASLATGAPPLQQVKPSLGGAVFPRQQYNGVLRLLSNLLAYLNKGNNFTFDTKNTSGYALGAVLFDYNSNKWVVSLKNANKNNFVTNPTLIDGENWQFITVNPTNQNNFTVSPTVPTLAVTDTTTKVANMAAINQAVTQISSLNFSSAIDGVLSVSEAQARKSAIVIGGTLTGDVNVQLPAIAKTYFIYISGSLMGYNLTISSTTGASQPLFAGGNLIATNGVITLYRLSALYNTTLYGNSYYNYDIASNDNSYRLANTAFVQNISALMGKLSANNTWSALNNFTVSPTVPTPAKGSNDTKVANMAALFAGLADKQNISNTNNPIAAHNSATSFGTTISIQITITAPVSGSLFIVGALNVGGVTSQNNSAVLRLNGYALATDTTESTKALNSTASITSGTQVVALEGASAVAFSLWLSVIFVPNLK